MLRPWTPFTTSARKLLPASIAVGPWQHTIMRAAAVAAAASVARCSGLPGSLARALGSVRGVHDVHVPADVAIVGGGHNGLVAGILLARQGLRVQVCCAALL